MDSGLGNAGTISVAMFYGMHRHRKLVVACGHVSKGSALRWRITSSMNAGSIGNSMKGVQADVSTVIGSTEGTSDKVATP